MYYVIFDGGVIQAKSVKEVQKKTNSKIEEVEFKSLGPDKVVQLSNDDLNFIQDKKRLALIPIANLYKADNIKLFIYLLLFLQFILLIKK